MSELSAKVARYEVLVQQLAREVGRTGGKASSPEELVSAGTLGLLRAIGTFDPRGGVTFSTHACRMIRAAMAEDRRAPSWATSSARARARRLAVAATALRLRLGRMPEPEEMAAQLDLSLGTYRRWREETCLGLPADGAAGAEGEEVRADRLREAVARLPRKERTLLALVLWEGLAPRQVAEVLRSTEAHVTEVLERATQRLRERLNRAVPEPAAMSEG